MKCKQCGKTIDKNAERKEFDAIYRGNLSYDNMGFVKDSICLDCNDSNKKNFIFNV